MKVRLLMHTHQWTVRYLVCLATVFVIMYGISLWRHW